MKFTWNPEKRIRNLKKHGFDFADAERVFSGHTLVYPDLRFEYGEARFITVGLLNGVTVVIVHTETENEIRIISMRKAERYERELYYATR